MTWRPIKSIECSVTSADLQNTSQGKPYCVVKQNYIKAKVVFLCHSSQGKPLNGLIIAVCQNKLNQINGEQLDTQSV